MFRPIALFSLVIVLMASLSGCIVVDHHGHGKHLPPGQFKKLH